MPNLMLTNYCNYNCSYCFGKDIMYPKNPRLTMTRDCFNGIVECVGIILCFHGMSSLQVYI